MKKQPDQQDSLAERMIDRVSSLSGRTRPKKPRRLVTESLEPRIFFSGSPAPTPSILPADLGSPSVHEAPPLQTTASATQDDVASPSDTIPTSEGEARIDLTGEEFVAFISLSLNPITTPFDPPLEIVDLFPSAPVATSALFFSHPDFQSPGFGWSVSFSPPETIEVLGNPGDSGDSDFDRHSTSEEDPGALRGEILFDPSLLESPPAAPAEAAFDSTATLALTVLGYTGLIGTLANPTRRGSPIGFQHPVRTSLFGHSARSQFSPQLEKASLPLTQGDSSNRRPMPGSNPPDLSAKVTPSPVLPIFSDDLCAALQVSATPPTSERPEADILPAFTSTITFGRYSKDHGSRESDRLFVDVPGFDFTTLPSAIHGSLISRGNPFVLAEADPTKKYSKPKSAKKRKREQAEIPPPFLTGSTSGASFAGDSFSVEAWIHAPSCQGSQFLFSIDDDRGLPRALYASLEDRSLVLNFRSAGFRYRDQRILFPDAVSGTDSSHHLAIVRDGHRLTVFLDGSDLTPPGTQISGLTIFGDRVTFDPPDPILPTPSSAPAAASRATICEFALFNHALDTASVTSHYNSGFARGKNGIGFFGRRTSRHPKKALFVGGNGTVSRSPHRLGYHRSAKVSLFELEPDSELSGIVPPQPPTDSQKDLSVLQSLLGRVADCAPGFAATKSDLGIFVSMRNGGAAEAEVKIVDWDVTESILAHFGATHSRYPFHGDAEEVSHSLFISDEVSEDSLCGFIAVIADSGQFSSVTPLTFDPDLAGSPARDDLLTALKLPRSSPVCFPPSGTASPDSSEDDRFHLAKMSSVQSDVFGIGHH